MFSHLRTSDQVLPNLNENFRIFVKLTNMTHALLGGRDYLTNKQRNKVNLAKRKEKRKNRGKNRY